MMLFQNQVANGASHVDLVLSFPCGFVCQNHALILRAILDF